MASIAEARGNQSPWKGPLDAGVDTISLDQTVTFTRYLKVILPLDGFVFWVKADILGSGSIFNFSTFNSSPFDQNPQTVTPANQITVKGSLHYETDGRQVVDETIAIRRVQFTSEQHVQALAEISPRELYMAELPDGNLYSFGGRRMFYRQSGLWHYEGDAVYAAMRSQIINSPLELDTSNVVVSNSLPFWLAIDQMNPPLGWWPAGQRIPLYPSFLVPDNLPPPYGVIDIPSMGTRGLQSAPVYDLRLGQTQLCTDHVEVTLYGTRNFNAQDFVGYVQYYALRTEHFGIMNIPVIQDEKRTQLELSAIAMKKKVVFDIDYQQSRARDVARQLILSVDPTFDIEPPAF